MNNIISKNIFPLIFSLTITILPQSSQRLISKTGLPLIKNYLPRDYKAHNQNWSIVKDNRGVMYFGNSSGLLEFDGYDWNLIEVPNGIVRSLAVDNKGTIFIGCADEAGYLSRDPRNGTSKYQSLVKYLPLETSFGHVWYTFSIEDFIFFITDDYIFRFYFENKDYTNPKVKYWKSKVRYRIAHKVENTLYVQETKDGLLKYDNGEFKKAQKEETIFDATIFSMLPYDNNFILIAIRSKGLFLYNEKEIRPFETEAFNYLDKNEFYLPGAKLPDGTFAFNTTQGGIIIIYPDGRIARIIDTKSGIQDDGVLFIYYSDGKLWLALQNGISVIDYPSSIGYFNSNLGIKGAVSEIKIDNNNLYAATTAGVSKINISNNYSLPNQFYQLPGANQEAWEFAEFNGNIFVILTDGIYSVKENSLQKIKTDLRDCYSIFASQKIKNRLYVGTGTGLAVLDLINNKWVNRGKIQNLNVAVKSICEDKSGNIWLGTSYDGLYQITNIKSDLTLGYDVIHSTAESDNSNNEYQIFTVNGDLWFISKNGVEIFDPKSKSLILESKTGINKIFQNALINFLFEDRNGILWVSAVDKNAQLTLKKGIRGNDGSYSWQDLSFLRSVIDFSNKNAVTSISKDEKTGIVWFCGADGIISYNELNQNFDEKKAFNVLISNVTLNGDSVLYIENHFRDQLKDKNIYQLESDFYSLRFRFSSLKFDGDLSEYQYKLEGFNDNWSDWSSEHIKDYTNLPPGNYEFRVRAKDIMNRMSSESFFKFSVLSPWYLKWYSFFIYALLLITIGYFILKFRFNYLTNRNLKLESIIADRTKVIREQAEKLEELDEIKTKFFTNVSHEFRTPLTLMIGYIQQIAEKNKDENINNEISIVRRNSKKLLELINQLLDFSKLSSGKMKLETSPYNIVGLVKSLMLTFSPFADRKNISFNLNTFSDELIVFVDKDKFDKILTNILSNAFKFTPEFGKIDVSISENNGFAIISVADNGIGIPKDKARRIFDRFYQADSSSTKEQEGTGIGLSLAKELVELHKGRIELETEEGRGTTFSILFKLGKMHLSEDQIVEKLIEPELAEEIVRADLNEIKNDDSDLLEDIINSSEKPRLLLVEDNFEVRRFVKENLRDNYLITEAVDGLAGLEKAFEAIPDLIISDVMMPKMDGYKLCESLKTDARTSHIPIILLTAKAEIENRITGFETGADDYIVKPFEMSELKVRIKNLIEQRKRLHNHLKTTGLIELEESSITSVDKKFLQGVYDLINKNISHSDFNVEALSRNIGMSRAVLHKKLISLIGESPVELIRRIRLNKSAELIEKKFGNLSEIALEVGFNNPAYFSECFKKQFGVTPSQYPSKSNKI